MLFDYWVWKLCFDLFRNELSRSVVRVVEESCRKTAKTAIFVVNFTWQQQQQQQMGKVDFLVVKSECSWDFGHTLPFVKQHIGCNEAIYPISLATVILFSVFCSKENNICKH